MSTLLPEETRPRLYLGYALYLAATVLFAVNGSIVKAILQSGVSATSLSEVRATGAFVILLIVVAISRPQALRVRRSEWKFLLAYGVIGVSMTQYLYFVALERMAIGIALVIEFTAPIFVVLWVRFGRKQPVRSSVWVGLVLALSGLTLIAQIWQGLSLDLLGVAAAFGAALALALFYVIGEHQRRGHAPRDALSLTMWGMGGAALFWAIAQPWWNFPWTSYTGESAPLGGVGPTFPIGALTLWMIVLGTVVPFTLAIASLAHITAAQASTIGITEPLIASMVAWVALGEVLTPLQIAGGITVLVGVYIAERSR